MTGGQVKERYDEEGVEGAGYLGSYVIFQASEY